MKFGLDVLKHSRDVIAARYDPEEARIIANIYWRTLLFLAFLVVISIFAYGIWGLMGVLTGLSITGPTSAPPPALNRAALDATVEGFKTRSAQFELLTTSPGTTTPDPSR